MEEAMEKVARGSRRARNKEAKLESIRRAAWALMLERGYDATTTREVAKRADVAVGTVFVYAPQKRDLVFLAMHEALSETMAQVAKVPRDGPLVGQLEKVFGAFLELYDRAPGVGRAFVRELQFPEGEIRQPKEITALTQAFLGEIADRIEIARKAGQVDRRIDALALAQVFFGLYFMAVTALLGGAVYLADAKLLLKRNLTLVMRGAAAREAKS